MSTEQIYKDNQDKYISSERENSLDRYQKAKFKIKRKISQLENKSYFFQGQLNPITIQNKALKQRLIQLLRAVSASSDLLRNLIPVQGNSTRKLQLQTANLEEISAMIKQDWLDMKENIRCMNQQIREKNGLIESLQFRYKQTVQNYESVIKNNQIKYETEITERKKKNQELVQQIEVITCKWKQEKQQIIRSYDAKLEQAENVKKQYQQYIKEMNQKCVNYERLNQRLKDQIALNLEEFEKSKLNLKQIYEGIMQSKVEQLNEEFQMMIRMKEQQKMRMLEQMNANIQQLKKKISQKNSQISHMSGLNDKLKQQIGAAKDEVWSQKLKIDAYTKQIKQLSERLFKQQEAHKSFKLKLQESQQQIEEMKKKYAKSKQEYEEQIGKQRAKYQKLEQLLEEEKKIYEGKLSQSELKLQQFRRKLRQNGQKYEQMLQQQRKKYQQRILKYEQDEKLLRETIQRAQKKIKEKQQQIQNIQRAHKQQLQQLEKQNEQKSQKLRAQIEKIIYENEQRIKIIRKQHQRMIEQLQFNNNQYIRKMVAEHNMKLYQQQQKYNTLLQTSENLKNELSSALQKNKMLENQCILMSQNMKRAAQQHRRMLEEQRRESEKLLEMEKKKMFDQMQEQIASLKRAMEEKQAQYKNQLSQIQESMLKQINMLKMATAVDEVEEKYNNMIAKMREEMENQIKRLEQRHSQELLMLSRKLEFDITKLNEDLLSQKQAHQFSKMSREDKINYLVSKINDYRNEMVKKDNQILQLQYQLQKKNKQLQKVDQLVAEKVKKVKAQFDQEVMVVKAECQIENKRMESQCQRKVKKIQTERIQFTQLLYNQFQELKNKYDLDMRRLQKKYDELERIFQERPSRAEDLSKIKQLIEERTKMDLQIKQFKKRVKQANQIVKYLNLQLQNYKQTYDIFGPGPGNQPSSPERRVNTEIDSPIKSLIRRDPTSITSQDSSRGHKEKRTINQSQDLNQFRLFPSIARNMSVAEDENESETSHHRNKEQKSVLVNLKKRSGQKLMFSQKVEQEDKSEELRNNASIFMGLLNKDQKLPVETKKNNGYSKKLSRRKSLAISYDKKLQLKDKTIVFQP